MRIAALFILLSGLLLGCGKTKIIYKDILDPVDIVLEESEKVLNVGDTYQIHAKYIVDDEEKTASFSYRSLDTSVASVSETGLVQAVGIGETIVQITYEKTKSLLKIKVQGDGKTSLLGLNIFNETVSLYENDKLEFRYESRLDGKIIDLAATYYDYNQSIISISNNVITALKAGDTTAKIKVTYGDLVAEKSFTVSVEKAEYYLSCNYEDNQVVVNEDDLYVTYSLNYGASKIKDLTLSEMECTVSDSEVATVNGNAIKGLKKGAFDLNVSYHIAQEGKDVISSDSFSCRERYNVDLLDLDESVQVLNGEMIDYVPINSNESLVFDAWLKNGAVYNEPVESDLELNTRWKINEFDFSQDIKGAKSVAPSEGESGETKPAVLYSGDDDTFANGLTYELSKNSHDETQSDDTIAHIYLPKMDYRKCNKVIYHWKTNGWVAINTDSSHWYDYSSSLGGTIEINYDGETLTQTIIQNQISYDNDRIIITYNDNDIIQGNANLESIGYWAFTSLVAPNYIYLSNPSVTIVNCLTHNYVNTIPIDKIGYYNRVCSVCGRQTGPAEEIMILADIDFTKSLYGAHGGRWGSLFPVTDTDAFKTQKALKYEIPEEYPEANKEDEIFLPKINFTAYEVVQFNVTCSIEYIGVGLESGSYGLPSGGSNHSTGTLRFKNDDNNITVTLTCNETSTSQQITLSDSNIINGNAPLSLFMKSSAKWQTVTVELTVLVDECSHDYIDTIPTDKIGYYHSVCSLCDENGGLSENVMTLADVDFIKSIYGAYGGRWGDLFPVDPSGVFKTEKTLKYEVTEENVEADGEDEIFLPKINFSAYEVIQFNVSCDTNIIEAGLESGSYILPTHGDSSHSTGVLRFKTSGNQVTATLTCNETSLSQQVVITDTDIINGSASFSLFMKSSSQWQTVTIELITLLKECTHNFVNTIPTDRIGYYSTTCSTCGESGEPSDDSMTLADVDFTNSVYGAHGGRWGDEFPVDTSGIFKTEKTLKYEITEANVEDEIFLPRINYNAFKFVRFNVTCGSFAIATGLQSGSYILPYSGNSSDPAHTGVLTLKLNGNQLEASLKCNETSEVQNIIITDADIINGNSPLSLFMFSTYQWQTVIIELITLLNECTHNYVEVAPTDKIGYYSTTCSWCGEEGDHSDNALAFADIDFTTATYGAHGGRWGTNVQPTTKTMVYEVTEGGVENEIFLPKIDFRAYSSVTFNLSGNVWDARVGLETGSYAFPYLASGAHSGTLTFTYNGVELIVTLECADGVNQNLVITDADIINGSKAFSLFMTADDAYRTITIELTSLS